MTSRRLMECLFFQRPYFGPAMRALQGLPKRHAYMQAIVELLSREKIVGPIKILEVGSWAGGSAITWAKAIQKYFSGGQVVCVDHWRPYFDTSINSELVYVKMNEAAKDGSIYRLFLHNIRTSGVHDIVSPMVGNSRDVLLALNKNDFSIVYLDASHHFQAVEEDIRLSMDLVKEGGILCGDDLELQLSEVGATEVIQDVATEKDYVKSKIGDVFYHPGVTRAVAEAFGEVSVWEGFWAMRKTTNGWAKIDLSGCAIEIPEHISMAESFSPEPSNDRKQLIFSFNQIAERLAKAELESDGHTQNLSKLMGSYCGFNIVKLNEYYYAVRQSLGEIDWSLPYTELVNRYRETDFFRCSDTNAIITSIGIDELLTYLEELASFIAETLLRQEATMASLGARSAEIAGQLIAQDSQIGQRLTVLSSQLEKELRAVTSRTSDQLTGVKSQLEESLESISEFKEQANRALRQQETTVTSLVTRNTEVATRMAQQDDLMTVLTQSHKQHIETQAHYEAMLALLNQQASELAARLAEQQELVTKLTQRQAMTSEIQTRHETMLVSLSHQNSELAEQLSKHQRELGWVTQGVSWRVLRWLRSKAR